MPNSEEDPAPILLVDSPAVSLPSDVCVFSTIPEVEAFRFAAYWMKRADKTSARLINAVTHTHPKLEQRRMERKEAYDIYMEDVWDPTYRRHHEAWAAIDPTLAKAVEQFFYRFAH